MKHFVLIAAAAAMMIGQSATAQNRVKNLYTESATLPVEQVVNMEQTVQLNRYFFAGYNTLCLPMTVSAEQLDKALPGLKLERLEAIRQEGTTLSLYFVDCTAQGVEAGMPYLVFSPTTQYLRLKNSDANGFATDAHMVSMTDQQGNQISFGGSWSTRLVDGLYGIPAKQDTKVLESVLIRTTADQAFRPTRCGFVWESQSPTATRLEIKHVSSAEATAVQSLKAGETAGDVYDLQGHRLNGKPAKGVYIQNGKKVTVK